MALPKFDMNKVNKEKDKKDNTEGFGLPKLTMPSLDDEFEEVGVSESTDEVADDLDYEYNEEIYDEVGALEKHSMPVMGNQDTDEEYIRTEEDYYPDYEDDLEEEEHKYVDKKKKRVKPMGGKRSRRKVKAGEFDERKNILARTKVIRIIVLLFFIGFFALGVKNTFFPSHVYSDEQIRAFAREGAGKTEFPSERGEAYVESFMEAYLTFDRESPMTGEIISHYYGEDEFARIDSDQLRLNSNRSEKQKILIKPKVFEVTLLSDYSSQYKVSAYIANQSDSDQVNGHTGRWVSFAVNVYYDKVLNDMIITKDSPTIIPTYRLAKQNQIPTDAKIGNGNINAEILPALTPTINGYVTAYAETSAKSYEQILQYVYDKNDADLYTGFGGTVRLKDNASNSINKVIYDSDDGVYRADLEVAWVDNVASTGDNIIEYQARYIMKIRDMGDGKYSVESFKPYNYFKAPIVE